MMHRGIRLGGSVRRPEDALRLHKLGLLFAEIVIADPNEFYAVEDEYLAISRSTGLFYLCHGPQEGDPNDIQTLETVYFPALLKVLSLMPALPMRLLTMHLWMDPRFVARETIAYKIGFLERLVAKAQDSGVSVCIENLSEQACDLAEVFASVPLLNLTLDLGHAQLLTRENTSFDFLERFPERIKHLHLHDNFGGSCAQDDLHLPVGKGKIDFEKIFAKLHALPYEGTITLELKSAQIESCLEYVRALIDPERTKP